jgi:excisionase family DNA binding protein
MERNNKSASRERGRPEPLLVTIDTAAQMLGIGRSKMFELIRDKKVGTVRLGPQIRRVPVAALREYIARLQSEGAPSHDAA